MLKNGQKMAKYAIKSTIFLAETRKPENPTGLKHFSKPEPEKNPNLWYSLDPNETRPEVFCSK